MNLATLDVTILVIYAGRGFPAGTVGVARKGRTQERRAGLFPRQPLAAVVGHRHVADRGQHFSRTDRRHVGLGLRDGHGHRLIRMDGGADADHCRQMDPAGVPQERHLHHAGVSRAALQPRRAHRHGHLLAGPVRVRESHLDTVAGLARGERDHRSRHPDIDHGAGVVRAGLRVVRWPQAVRSPTSCR